MAIKILLFLCYCGVLVATANIIPCQYAKFHANHSACRAANPTCNAKIRNVTAYDIHVIISSHNELREKVAVGNESGQPSAANMRVLKWDSELAFIAQKLADQCRYERDCDGCREVERFPVGQQLRLWRRSSQSSQSNDTFFPNWEETISSWYKAVNFFNSGLIRQYSFTVSYGTYSQLVWANTSYVGCGFSAYTHDGMDEKLYVCNYGPTGNIISEEMYKVGPACESCPDNWSCSKQYPGLCAENEPADTSTEAKSSEKQLNGTATNDEKQLNGTATNDEKQLTGTAINDKSSTGPELYMLG